MLSNHLILCNPFSFCPQSFQASGSFLMSGLFASAGHSIGTLASAPVCPMNIQGWFPLGLSGLISWQSQKSSPAPQLKASIFWCSVFFLVYLSHPCMTTGKTIALIRWIFVGKVMFLLSNMLSKFVIAFPPRSKHLLISWLQSPSIVILKPKKIKSATYSIPPPSICHEMMGLDAMILVSWMFNFKQLFYCPLPPSSRGSLVPLHFLPLGYYHLHFWGCWYFSQQSWFQLMIHPAQDFTWCSLHIS